MAAADLAKEFAQDMDAPVTFEIWKQKVTHQDFLSAVKNVNRSVGNDDLQTFADWMKEFGATVWVSGNELFPTYF